MAAATFYSHIQNVDVSSASLIVQLQLEDLANVVSNFKGKGSAGSTNDQEYAFQQFREDLEAWQSILKDQQMSLSILQAQHADQQIIKQALREEEVALSDRRLAVQLEGRNVQESGPSGTKEPVRSEPDIDPEYAAKLTALYHSEEAGEAFLQETDCPKGESSARGARERSLKQRYNSRTCEACREDTKWFDLASLPCRHEYCRECIDKLFQASVKDESLFPPRCCRQRIALASVRIFLSSETAKSFEEKAPELDTPNRTYCHIPTCSSWIPSRNINNEVGTCPKCATTTCTICKLASHGLEDCPLDEGTNQVLEIAASEQWQRCYNCRRVIILSLGCHHMVCRCGAQFCYNCGSPWKRCNCAHFDEHRLLARAEQIHIRQRQEPMRRLEPRPTSRNERWIPPHLRESPVPHVRSASVSESDSNNDPASIDDPFGEELVREEDRISVEFATGDESIQATEPVDGPTRDETPMVEVENGDEELGQEVSKDEDALFDDVEAEVANGEAESEDEQQRTSASGVGLWGEGLASRPEQEHIALWPDEDIPELRPDSPSLDPTELDVAHILDHLRKYHDCTHERWKYIPGRHQCEECYQFLPEFIFECRGCFTRACVRCRRNRL